MRTKMLCVLGAITALVVPTSGQAGVGGQTELFETVTLEATVVTPVAAHLTISTRVRRYASTHLNQWAPPGQLPVTNLAEASSWIELRDLNNGQLLCRSAAPTAMVSADQSDVISAGTTDLGCPLALEVQGAGEPQPFARGIAARGPGLENGFELGYTRPGTVSAARINGLDADLADVMITRSRRVAATPYAS